MRSDIWCGLQRIQIVLGRQAKEWHSHVTGCSSKLFSLTCTFFAFHAVLPCPFKVRQQSHQWWQVQSLPLIKMSFCVTPQCNCPPTVYEPNELFRFRLTKGWRENFWVQIYEEDLSVEPRCFNPKRTFFSCQGTKQL